MKKTPGVIRFGLRAKVLSKQFWTYSVWRTPGAEFSIEDFVSTGNHKDALNAFPRLTDGNQAFGRWTSETANIGWPEALRHLPQ